MVTIENNSSNVLRVFPESQIFRGSLAIEPGSLHLHCICKDLSYPSPTACRQRDPISRITSQQLNGDESRTFGWQAGEVSDSTTGAETSRV